MKESCRFYALALSTTNAGLIYGTAQSLPVVMLLLMEALHLSYTEVSVFLSLFGIGQCIGFYPGGWLSDRCGVKPILSLGTAICGICLILWSLAPPYPVMCILYGLVGLAAAFAWPTAFALVTKWFPQDEHGRALGMMNAGWMGIMLILYSLVAPSIADHLGWQGPSRVFSVFLFLWVAIFLFTIKVPQEDKARQADGNGRLLADQIREASAVRNIGVWVMGIVGACYMVQFQVFMAFLPSCLQETCGFTLKQAGLATMIYICANIVGGIAGGVTADRIGILKTQIIGCLIAASAIIMAIWIIKDWTLLIIILFLCGFGPIFAMGPYYGLAPVLVSPERVASAMGLMSLLQWSPAIYVAVFSAWMLEVFGSYRPMFLFAAVAPLIGALLCLVGRRYVKQ